MATGQYGAVVSPGELTDEVWKRITPLLPENGRRGKQRKDHRKVVSGTSCGV